MRRSGADAANEAANINIAAATAIAAQRLPIGRQSNSAMRMEQHRWLAELNSVRVQYTTNESPSQPATAIRLTRKPMCKQIYLAGRTRGRIMCGGDLRHGPIFHWLHGEELGRAPWLSGCLEVPGLFCPKQDTGSLQVRRGNAQ